MSMRFKVRAWLLSAGAVGCLASPSYGIGVARGSAALAAAHTRSYLVQADSASAAAAAVVKSGGKVTRDLSIVRAVAARLSDTQLAALRRSRAPRVRVFVDGTVTATSAGSLPETYYPSEIGAQPLQAGGITGAGVTVAVVDSGIWSQLGPDQSAPGHTASRVIAQYDEYAANQSGPVASSISATMSLLGSNTSDINDLFGHGTHVSSIIASSGVATTGNFQGVAPGVNLVSVRVLGPNGQGTYSDVIGGIQWVINQRLRYNIRVMNLSLSAPARSPYYADPLNQAVMSAWNAGIVVVVAAGNFGPDPMTIGVPGNNPYAITVGAVTDGYHPLQPAYYRLGSFSSAGPTADGFVKPDV
jgi:serine protease AprX